MSYNKGTEIKPKTIYENNKSYQSSVQQYSYYNNFFDYDKKPYYGFNNMQGLEVVPKLDKIIIDDEFQIISFDFVIFAYKEMVNKFYSLLANGLISKDSDINSTLSNPAITLESIDFTPVLENNYQEFNKKILKIKEFNEETVDIKSYIEQYINNIPKLKSKTQTHIKYINNNRKKSYNGITINLIKTNLADDSAKIDFLKDINFPVLRTLCEQYGFYINKNAPWQLIANLSHPNILEIASKLDKDIKNSDDIIKKYYDVLLFKDYETQKVFFYNAYRNFYDKRQYFTESYFCQVTQETKVKIIPRIEPPTKEMFLKTEEIFFINMYIEILNAEMNFKFTLDKIRKIYKEAKVIYSKTLDKEKTLVYIFNKFRKTPYEQLFKQDKPEN